MLCPGCAGGIVLKSVAGRIFPPIAVGPGQCACREREGVEAAQADLCNAGTIAALANGRSDRICFSSRHEKHRNLVIFLPGIDDVAGDFARSGFIEEMRRHLACCASSFTHRRPAAVRAVSRRSCIDWEIAAAGGVAHREPGAVDEGDYQRALWAWLKRHVGKDKRSLPIYLGYGESGIFADQVWHWERKLLPLSVSETIPCMPGAALTKPSAQASSQIVSRGQELFQTSRTSA